MPYADPEREKARKKAYRKAYPEKEKSRAKAFRKANPELVAAKEKAYREANPEKQEIKHIKKYLYESIHSRTIYYIK